MIGDDNFDPDTNYHDSYDDDEEEVDLESAEGLAWQLLLLINPGDEDAALHQFAAYREAMAEEPSAEPIDTIKTVIDWRAGFHVSADDPKLLIEAIDELVARFQLTIDWGGDADDEDFLDDQDVPSLLGMAYDQLNAFDYTLWTWQTATSHYAGWMTLSSDDEAMRQVASAMAIDIRLAIDAA